MKKIFISIICLVVFLAGLAFVINIKYKSDPSKDSTVLIDALPLLVSERPELKDFVDEIVKWEKITNENPEHIENYLTLGLAWKSLGDRTQDPDYYQRTIDVYKKGDTKANGTNAILLRNIAVIYRVYLKQYDHADTYYNKAIEINSGDQSLYVDLAEMYEYQMHAEANKIIALLDKGIKIAFPSSEIQAYKDKYLLRQSQR